MVGERMQTRSRSRAEQVAVTAGSTLKSSPERQNGPIPVAPTAAAGQPGAGLGTALPKTATRGYPRGRVETLCWDSVGRLAPAVSDFQSLHCIDTVDGYL